MKTLTLVLGKLNLCMNSFLSLKNKISDARALDFGDILNESLQLFKKTWLQGFLFFLILIVIMMPILMAIYIPMYLSIMDQIQNGGLGADAAGNWIYYQGYTFRFLIIGLAGLISLVSVPVTAGFYGIVHKIDTSQDYGFKDFFHFFKKDYVMKIVAIAVFSLVVGLINFGIEKTLPQLLASLVNAVISGVFSIYTMLLVVFMAYNPELDVASIFNLSFNLGAKKFWLILGLLIVTGIIGFLGIIACFIGALFTFPIVYLPVYLVYKEVIGFNIVSDIDKIGTE